MSAIVTVPATTANIGPGFDCLGAALSLHNRFRFERAAAGEPSLTLSAKGLNSDRLSTDKTNLLYQSFATLYERLGQAPPAVRVEVELAVPLSRGLGSSATAIVGGLLGANALAGNPFAETDILNLAVEIEGHPDNVVPALLGGCRLAVRDEDWTICEIPWHDSIGCAVAMPAFELSTAEARKVLPQRYDCADAVFNCSHLGLLLRGLEIGNGDWLRRGMGDRLHQPYRQQLIPGYGAVRRAALQAGAYGLAISGAGPTLLALCASENAPAVAEAMAAAWQKEGVRADGRSLALDRRGAQMSYDS